MLHVDTASGRWQPFCDQIRDFLKADIIELSIDGMPVRGFRSPDTPALWIRDHSDILRGGKYVEPDVQSAVTCFANAQAASGRIYDYVTTFPEKKPCERENWEKWVRVPVEADVEFRFVKAAYLAWQASGDDAWMAEMLPACDRALTYCLSHPWRWDDQHGLLKRPYTIDTWDFDYTAGRTPWLNFAVTDDTYWGLMHGDNSGFYEAARLLARMYAATGQRERASECAEVAEGLRQRANTLLFNGRFYTHFYKLTPVTIDGVDEADQLSLSNPMDINRGLATHEMAVAILQTYQQRRETTGAFAEWFSIDPPFPDGVFGDEKLVGGAYCNGGILPLVGGELARAAFSHGFEQYGVSILDQYREMIAESGETYLWYFPDGTASTEETSTSPEATPTDGWGSSAMLYAFVEGLCGIEDRGHSYRHVRCSPRWAATDEVEATVQVGYAASGATFGYRYAHDAAAKTLSLAVEAEQSQVQMHVLLPEGCHAVSVTWNGKPMPFMASQVEQSKYVDIEGGVSKQAMVEVRYGND
ncbi:MAG TPA: hypothetical protein VKP65_13650 [Rhodothermales bacterium]|nr:hypothetical protein [Rhodothermales bacterium]